MNKMLPILATATAVIGATAIAAERPTFSQLDKNNDGYVSHEEAAAAPDIMKLFAAVDTNHDNQLSQTEYANALKQLQG